MRPRITAKRYARALAEVLKDEGGLEQGRQCLDALATALDEIPEGLEFFANPEVQEDRKADALHEALESMGAGETLKGFARVLCEKRRAGLLPLVAEEFARLADREAGIVRGRLVSAAPLEEASVERLREAVSRRMGQSVALHPEVDESLLAGVALRIGNSVYDASLRGRLERLKRHFRHGE